jgi:hypothetical protein
MRAPRDTSSAAWSRILDGYRQLSPEQRVRLALEMSDEVTAIAEAGIRARHPDWTDARIREEVRADLRGLGGRVASDAG